MAARLVVVGDSLSQGFQSAAISRTDWSYPAMVARALGEDSFRSPDFDGAGLGGPLVDIERLVRRLEREVGGTIEGWDPLRIVCLVERHLDALEDHWERGPGARRMDTGPHHNLSVWGFEIGDALELSDAAISNYLGRPRDNLLNQIIEYGMYRTAQRTLNPSRQDRLTLSTQIDLVEDVAVKEGGIENLVVFLGANHALKTCLNLKVVLSEAADLERPSHERRCTLYREPHFAMLYDKLAVRVSAMRSLGLVKNVFVGTIPHVTIVPVTRGISPGARAGEERDDDGYYSHYTRFWVWDEDFAEDPERYEFLERAQVRSIDACIDGYNDVIRTRAEARGFHVVDYGAMLDSLAFRRSGGKPSFVFPAGLVAALREHATTAWRVKPRRDGGDDVLLDTRFFRPPQGEVPASFEDAQCVAAGGLFSLDGVHPTTMAYGLMAERLLMAMKAADVRGADPERLAWDRIVAADTLVSEPPALLGNLRETLERLFLRGPLPKVIARLSGDR